MPATRLAETLTIVGASARAAAQSALRGGYAVVAADLFADRDLARLCSAQRVSDYPAGLGEAIAGKQPGGWIYTGGLENYPRLIDVWAQRRPLLGVGGDALRGVRRPEQVAAALIEAGLPAPAVLLAPPRRSDARTWLKKPLASSGGGGVRLWNAESDEEPESDERPRTDEQDTAQPPSSFYYQEFIEGQACSAVYLAAAGEALLLGATRQLVGVPWLGCDGFRYAGSIGPWPLSARLEAAFRRIGEAIARRFGLSGVFGVDAVARGDEVWAVEVNPRYPASAEVLERAGRFSAVALHGAACRDGQLPRSPRASAPPTGQVSGKAILFARRAATISAALSDAWLEAALGPTPSLADAPTPGAAIAAGWPVLTLLADGADESEVLTRLEALAMREGLRLEA